MTPGRVAGFLLLVAAFAAGTFVAWWMVPAIAGFWGALRPSVPRPAAAAGLAAAVAWTAWLAGNGWMGRGALSRIGAQLEGLLAVPGPLLLLATIAFGALLAWSAAVLGGAIPRRST
ncbi:MAG: hypothetical protein ACRENB_16120 [Gemmatimonadales bacterium]